MPEPINGKVAEVLDNYRIVVNRGSDDGIKEDMKFQVYTRRKISDPDGDRNLGEFRFDKAVVHPETIYDKMTLMKTETYSYEVSSILSNLPFNPGEISKKSEIKTDEDTEDDIEVVSVGDLVEQIPDEDHSTGPDGPNEDEQSTQTSDKES